MKSGKNCIKWTGARLHILHHMRFITSYKEDIVNFHFSEAKYMCKMCLSSTVSLLGRTDLEILRFKCIHSYGKILLLFNKQLI